MAKFVVFRIRQQLVTPMLSPISILLKLAHSREFLYRVCSCFFILLITSKTPDGADSCALLDGASFDLALAANTDSPSLKLFAILQSSLSSRSSSLTSSNVSFAQSPSLASSAPSESMTMALESRQLISDSASPSLLPGRLQQSESIPSLVLAADPPPPYEDDGDGDGWELVNDKSNSGSPRTCRFISFSSLAEHLTGLGAYDDILSVPIASLSADHFSRPLEGHTNQIEVSIFESLTSQAYVLLRKTSSPHTQKSSFSLWPRSHSLSQMKLITPSML